MRTRSDYLEWLRDIPNPEGFEGPRNAIQALLLVAATIANKLSENSVDISIAHISETMVSMTEVLEETFDVTLIPPENP